MTGITLDTARDVLAAQPFSELLDARLVDFGGGQATLELDVRNELRQQNGFVHGGVLCYAADNAITFAAGTVAGSRLLTSGLSIDYLRPADGLTLRAYGQVVRAGKTRVVCRADVFTVDDEGLETLCAAAQGTITVLALPPRSPPAHPAHRATPPTWVNVAACTIERAGSRIHPR